MGLKLLLLRYIAMRLGKSSISHPHTSRTISNLYTNTVLDGSVILSVGLSVRYRNHFPVVQFQNQAHILNPHGTGHVFKTIWGAAGAPCKGRRRRPKFGAPKAPQIFYLFFNRRRRRRKLSCRPGRGAPNMWCPWHPNFLLFFLISFFTAAEGAQRWHAPGGRGKSRRRREFTSIYILPNGNSLFYNTE